MNGVVRIGVLGCADIAVRRVLPSLAGMDSARLVAVGSRDPDRAERVARRFGATPVAGYDHVVARDDVDAVYIPLPPASHHRWIVESLRAGKHVLAEKPLCTNAADTAEVVTLARERGLVLVENFFFPHHSQHRMVQDLVRDGVIGEVRAFSSAFGIPPVDRSSFRYRTDLGGGALLDVGVYPLRAARLHLGDDLRVAGAWLRADGPTGVDTAGAALLSTGYGVAVHADFGFEHAYRSDYVLWGSAGMISVPRAFTPPEHLRPTVRVEEQDRVTEHSLPPDDQVRNALRAFVDAVLGRAPAPAGEQAVRHAALVDEVRAVATPPACAHRSPPRSENPCVSC
ncbi:Gfo/Idh/MocA family protein [Actinokineospora globicatena]|uniref:Oxidoreductase n=1 Tax=Actinokineospora globicatena TaxID=103729 RepID=A0A9W6V530_9PSEU|nr:Gfo/Idh/MocA family oxidoreductase [Actinokineospora globicatena]GLW89885.1 oxidoreductase [Actinokineospora globicatena]